MNENKEVKYTPEQYSDFNKDLNIAFSNSFKNVIKGTSEIEPEEINNITEIVGITVSVIFDIISEGKFKTISCKHPGIVAQLNKILEKERKEEFRENMAKLFGDIPKELQEKIKKQLPEEVLKRLTNIKVIKEGDESPSNPDATEDGSTIQ